MDQIFKSGLVWTGYIVLSLYCQVSKNHRKRSPCIERPMQKKNTGVSLWQGRLMLSPGSCFENSKKIDCFLKEVEHIGYE